MTHARAVSQTREATPSLRISAVVMIVVGIVALFAPGVAGVSASILFGIAILLAGLAYGAFAVAAIGTGSSLWPLLVSFAFTLAGIYLMADPLPGLVTLTAVIAGAFFIEGIAELGSYVLLRAAPRSGYLLVNAATSLILALLIWRNWPSSSAWAIGTLVGVDLITSGVTRLLGTT